MNHPSKTAGTPVDVSPQEPITSAVSLPARVHRDEYGVVWARVPGTPYLTFRS